MIRHLGGNVAGKFEAFVGGAFGKRLQCVTQCVAQHERDRLELQATSLDLREVENVVDQVHQRVGGMEDDRDVSVLLLGKLGAFEQFRHADHAVHWRADLVAHVRKKLALGNVGLLGRVTGPLKLLTRLAQLLRAPLQLGRALGHQFFQAMAVLFKLGDVGIDTYRSAVAGLALADADSGPILVHQIKGSARIAVALDALGNPLVDRLAVERRQAAFCKGTDHHLERRTVDGKWSGGKDGTLRP